LVVFFFGHPVITLSLSSVFRFIGPIFCCRQAGTSAVKAFFISLVVHWDGKRQGNVTIPELIFTDDPVTADVKDQFYHEGNVQNRWGRRKRKAILQDGSL